MEDKNLDIEQEFCTSSAIIDYIIADFSLNRISDRENYFMRCVNDRVNMLSKEYNDKVDKILNYIILHFDYSNYPIESITKIIYSLSKITNAVSKGILSLIKE